VVRADVTDGREHLRCELEASVLLLRSRSSRERRKVKYLIEAVLKLSQAIGLHLY